ncbi:ankyrin repeat-containing protein NPR4-like [Impatiens glandulifera]|uniref:ankyrin repeat-containing protein NPR4-like n=1 Tax=Impatiens glandulifera TaxID=253017 RepID=UPI001FB146B6|nr:ankyrin repeat-containing protein NPR4-like [Impatiens glandulifera]
MTAKRRQKAIRREKRRKAFEDQNPVANSSCMISSDDEQVESTATARSLPFPNNPSLHVPPIHKSQSNPVVSSHSQLYHHQSLPIPYATEDPLSSSSQRGSRTSVYPTYPIVAAAGESSMPMTINRSVQTMGDPLTSSKHGRLSGQTSGAVPAYPSWYIEKPTSNPVRGHGFVDTHPTNSRVSRKEATEIDVENPIRHQTQSNHVEGLNAERRSPLVASGSRSDYLQMCVPLYQAALKGDWGLAKSIFDKHPTAFLYGITAGEETVLHIAAAAKHVGFVEKLVKHMGEDDLTLQNKYGNTALCFAAASGVVKIAEIMIANNKKLPMIPGSQKMVPLHLAALLGHRSMSYYLYDVTVFELLEREEQVELLSATISTGIYDLALGILKKDPSLAITRNRNKETALHVLARKPSEISWDIDLGVKDKVLKRCFKWLYNKALMKTLAHQLVDKIWNRVLQLQENEITDLISSPSRLLFDAVEQGNVEFLVMLIRSYPDLMWTVNGNRYSLFHTAILCRQERILKLIYEIGAIKELLVCLTDKDNNNMLHLAGRLAPTSRLTIVSGAALQMQRELLWFKKVEKIVPPSFTKMKNSRGQTPQDLFTKEHQDLRREGEKWMKDTATSCMLVATLIATVVFAAAFTVPGGTDNDSGIPIFLKEKWFTTFAISDAVAMLTSTTSILMFLSILTSRYAEQDFLVSLPGKLTLGLTTLFASIGSMVLAFTAAFFLVYHGKMKEVPILIACLAAVPVTLFVLLYYKLWVEVLRSMFWSKFLFLHNKRRLF